MAILAGACHRGDNAWEQFKAPYLAKGTTIRIHSWMKWGLGAVASLSHDPQAQAVVPILRRMKAVEIHILPAGSTPSAGEITRLSGRLQTSGYASLVDVRSAGARVNLWARDEERTDELRDPLVMIRDDEVMVLVEMKGTLSVEDVHTLLSAAGSLDQE